MVSTRAGHNILCDGMTTGKLKSFFLVLLVCMLITILNLQKDEVSFINKDWKYIDQSPAPKPHPVLNVSSKPNIVTTAAARSVQSSSMQEWTSKRLFQPNNPVFFNHTQNSKTRKVILLVTNKRSGSSFVGEMFMRNPKAYYLFEPLFPYTRECHLLQKERIETLEKFSRCQFDDVRQEYAKVFNWTHKEDTYAKCKRFNVCFLHRNPTLIAAYNQNVPKTKQLVSLDFAKAFDGTVLSKLCSSSDFTVFKVLRTCQMSSFIHLIKGELPGYTFKIIHLLRDPRAIISSRMQIPGYQEEERKNFEDNTEKLCNRMDQNIRLTNDVLQTKYKTSYMRVRLEDIAINPMKYARQFYHFIQEPFPPQVSNWLYDLKIKENTGYKERSQTQKMQETFKTNRKAKDVLNSWRRDTDFEKLQIIQKRCSSVLDLLRYKQVKSKEDLLNENISLVGKIS